MPIAVDSKKWKAEYVQGVVPSNPKNGMTWFDTLVNGFKIYDSNTSSWIDLIRGPGSNYGYSIGGANGSTTITTIDRFLFPFD